MPDPNPRQGGVPDPWLTSMAISYMDKMQEFFVADKVFPTIPSATSYGRYKEYGRSYFLQDNAGPRPIGGYPRQVGFRWGSNPYQITADELEAVIDDQERPDLDYPGMPGGKVDIERDKINLLVSQLMVRGDRKWANAFMKPGVWGTDLTGVASLTPTATQFTQWDNDNSKPSLFLDQQRGALGDKYGDMWRPNKLVLGRQVYTALRNHPVILNKLGVNQDRILGKEDLARFFDMDPGSILVPGGIYNSGPEKESFADTETAAVYNRIVSTKDALLVYANPTPSSEAPSGGYGFRWTGYLGANAMDPRAGVTRGRDPRAYSDWFHCRTAVDYRITAPGLGIYLINAVA